MNESGKLGRRGPPSLAGALGMRFGLLCLAVCTLKYYDCRGKFHAVQSFREGRKGEEEDEEEDPM